MSLAAISVIIATSIVIIVYIQNKLKTSRLLFYTGIIYYMVIILFYIIQAIWSKHVCHHRELAIILATPAGGLYTLQAVMLVLLLFIRLVSIFKATSFALSTLTIKLYIAILIIGPITYSLFLLTRYSSIGMLFYMITISSYLFAVIYLNGLLIHKLFTVHIQCSANDKRDNLRLNTITKTTILSILSTSLSVVFLTTYILYSAFSGSLIFLFMTRLLLIADVHTNFLSILLSYKYFKHWYRAICGCCHDQCVECWAKLAKHKDVNNMMTNVNV